MPARPRTTIHVRNPFLREFAHRQIPTSPDCSDVNIVHRPVARDFPTLDRIIVIDGMQPASCDQALAAGLHVAGLIGASALEDGFLSIPAPGEPEARVTLGQHRLLELSLPPGLPSVGTDFDLRHPSSPAPCQSADIPKARPNMLSTIRTGGHGLGLSHDS